MRLVIESPVAGVAHSLQAKDDAPLDAKTSKAGEALTFELALRVAPGPKFFGDQVRREGPERRFVYVRIGTAAGQASSPWSRRMKIDIHDIPRAVLDEAVAGKLLEGTIHGTGKDGTPACASVRVQAWRAVAEAHR